MTISNIHEECNYENALLTDENEQLLAENKRLHELAIGRCGKCGEEL